MSYDGWLRYLQTVKGRNLLCWLKWYWIHFFAWWWWILLKLCHPSLRPLACFTLFCWTFPFEVSLSVAIIACHCFGALMIRFVSLLGSTIFLPLTWSVAVITKRCFYILVVVIVLMIGWCQFNVGMVVVIAIRIVDWLRLLLLSLEKVYSWRILLMRIGFDRIGLWRKVTRLMVVPLIAQTTCWLSVNSRPVMVPCSSSERHDCRNVPKSSLSCMWKVVRWWNRAIAWIVCWSFHIVRLDIPTFLWRFLGLRWGT